MLGVFADYPCMQVHHPKLDLEKLVCLCLHLLYHAYGNLSENQSVMTEIIYMIMPIV
jgi:hypothetical protein